MILEKTTSCINLIISYILVAHKFVNILCAPSFPRTRESRAFHPGCDLLKDLWSATYINNGKISTSVGAEDGNGGNIRLAPEFIVLDKGKIKADATKGNGGDVMINTTGIYNFSKELVTGPDENAAISAHSELGIDGEIRIHSPDTDISGDLIVPAANFLRKEKLAIQRCEQAPTRDVSRFTVAPLKDLPVPPDDLNTVEP